MTKKVLHIFGIMNRGGAELRTLALLEGLAKQGIALEFCVLSGQQGVLDDKIRQLGSEVHYCPLGPLFIIRFYQLLRQNKFSAVHSHVALVSGFILTIAKLANIKQRIAHFRSTQEKANISFIRRMRNRFLRQLINFSATNIVGVCRAALSAFWRKDWHKDNRCQVIYNGLPQLNYQAKQPPFWPEKNLNDNIPIMINVARMHPAKNHLRMLDILQSYHQTFGPIYLVLLGKENDKDKHQLLAKAQQLQISEFIYFAGEQSDVYPFLQNADVMLFPSLWEGLPGAVIEAASTGLPVIASNIPGVVEISEQLHCVKSIALTQHNNIWAKAIYEQVIGSKEQGQKQRQAQITVFNDSNFNIEQCLAEFYVLYR